MSGRRWAIGVVAALVLTSPASRAAADAPSIWARARRPDLERRTAIIYDTPRAWAGENQPETVETLLLRYERLHRPAARRGVDRRELALRSEMLLTAASLLLEEAGARTSSDLFARSRLADVYGLLGKPAKAAPIFESILLAEPPPMLRAQVHAQLAIEYAHMGRVEDEIKQYGEALRVQAVPFERSRLLANRAEAYMLTGDVTRAVEGYRDALALLATDGMLFGTGPTTLWGLAVALDRSGDLDAGLESVRLARSYDPQDQLLNDEGWFYLPAYDSYWYGALGHWMVARKTDMGSVRAQAYARAVAAWEGYVSHAAPDDKWVAVARVRLAQCQKERAEFLRREKIRMTEEARHRGKKAEPPTRPLTPEELMKGWDPDP